MLVNCGPKFELIECDLQNEKEPFIVDPEPELWHEEEQKNHKKEEEKRKYHEIRPSTVKWKGGDSTMIRLEIFKVILKVTTTLVL